MREINLYYFWPPYTILMHEKFIFHLSFISELFLNNKYNSILLIIQCWFLLLQWENTIYRVLNVVNCAAVHSG